MAASSERRKKFNDAVLADFEQAMDKFYTNAADKATEQGLGPRAVYDALWTGYGSEVADGWIEWYNGRDE